MIFFLSGRFGTPCRAPPPHLSQMLFAVWRKRVWSVSLRAWSAWVMREEDLSTHCLQPAICWASFLRRTDWAKTRAMFTDERFWWRTGCSLPGTLIWSELASHKILLCTKSDLHLFQIGFLTFVPSRDCKPKKKIYRHENFAYETNRRSNPPQSNICF